MQSLNLWKDKRICSSCFQLKTRKEQKK
jgi:hypothetical protein